MSDDRTLNAAETYVAAIEAAEGPAPFDLAAVLHVAIMDYSETESWPIVGDDMGAAEYLAARVGAALNEAGIDVSNGGNGCP